MKKYQSYHNYFIQDGKLIGEFEQMYQDFEDPWEQSTREVFSIEKIVGIELLKKYGHQKPLEYGCGLGYYTRQLAEHFDSVCGVDISETAIQKARKLASNQIKSNQIKSNQFCCSRFALSRLFFKIST